MAQVFVSWGSPNEKEARTVITALRNAPLDVWDSMHDMRGGDTPEEEVIQQIGEAKVAVFLLSDLVVHRPWIQRELNWCYQEYKKRGGPRIVPARVGPFQQIPELPNLPHVEDLSQLNQSTLQLLVSIVRKHLGILEPLVVPAALYAMTLKEFQQLPATDWATAAAICQALGMPQPAANAPVGRDPLSAELERRYGETPEDFKPFGDATLKEVVERAQYVANTSRGGSERPVLVRWCQEELRQGDGAAVDDWSSKHSLLFVDSISLASAAIRGEIVNLPWPENRSRSAVVWIPPYTRHTARLQQHVSNAIRQVTALTQAFNAFISVKDTERPVTFDLFSPAALEHWLLHALGRPLRDQAVASAVAAMNRLQPPPPFVPRRDLNPDPPPST